MTSAAARASGAILVIAATTAMVWASSAALTVHGSNRGVLRLAWSARPERIEVCREQSAEELARLPQHMRQPVVCEGRSARYRLTVRHEGRLVIDRMIHGGGVRQDRRLYVFEEVPLDPGPASIDIRLDRIDEASTGPAPRGNQPPLAETVPPTLRFAQQVAVRPRQVLLITYAAERGALTVVEEASRR